MVVQEQLLSAPSLQGVSAGFVAGTCWVSPFLATHVNLEKPSASAQPALLACNKACVGVGDLNYNKSSAKLLSTCLDRSIFHQPPSNYTRWRIDIQRWHQNPNYQDGEQNDYTTCDKSGENRPVGRYIYLQRLGSSKSLARIPPPHGVLPSTRASGPRPRSENPSQSAQ